MIPRDVRDSIIDSAKAHKGITVELAMNCNELEDCKKVADLQLHATVQKAQEYIQKYKIHGKLGDPLVNIVVDDAIKLRAENEKLRLQLDNAKLDAEMPSALRELAVGCFHLKGCAALSDAEDIKECDCQARYDSAIKERDHWKANHDNQVTIKAAILDRPDLNDRAKLVMDLIAEQERLRSCVGKLQDITCAASDIVFGGELAWDGMDTKDFTKAMRSAWRDIRKKCEAAIAERDRIPARIKELKRYELDKGSEHWSGPEMVEADKGDYVLYADVAAIQQTGELSTMNHTTESPMPRRTSAVLIEEYSAEGVSWVVSFTGYLPAKEDCVELKNKADAERIIKELTDQAAECNRLREELALKEKARLHLWNACIELALRAGVQFDSDGPEVPTIDQMLSEVGKVHDAAIAEQNRLREELGRAIKARREWDIARAEKRRLYELGEKP